MKKISNILLASSLALACQNQGSTADAKETNPDSTKTEITKTEPQDWLKGANIYEVNIRQYTPEGTINAFSAHLDRLQEMGVKILWIMPIQPIGEKNRKGSLGSYYSISDYTAVNPNFGTLEDFKTMVDMAHERGMKVILDWVANHTAFDHHWASEHPDWYNRNEEGEIIAPVEDWSDVADLNYDNMDMREAMREAMAFWLKEANIDGFRCDVAMMVPMDFWDKTREYLDSIKPVFMLAEAEGGEFHAKAFDMTYGWEPHHIMNGMEKGERKFWDMVTYIRESEEKYPDHAMRMFFTTNHDENSWNGTVAERMGANGKNYFVLCTTLPKSMPLIYGGQEAGLNHRLAFFEKDTIKWNDLSLQDFYKSMLTLKANHPCLTNGTKQAGFEPMETGDENAHAFRRIKGDNELLVYVNMGDKDVSVNPSYTEGKEYDGSGSQIIPAHGHLIISTK